MPWKGRSRWSVYSSVILAALLTAQALAVGGATGPGRPDIDRPDRWFDDHVYHHHADLTTELRELEGSHPEFMSLDSIGTSVRGRELWCVRIADPATAGTPKRQVYIDGEHHGNEYLSGELAILLIHHLLENNEDPLVKEVLADTVVWVTPMLNPDGNARDTRYNYNGIDLNRHYPFEFTPGGNHGDAPATEPEVKANVAFMEGLDLDLYLTMHTGTRAIIFPWGFTGSHCPDHEMFERFRGMVESYGLRYGPAYSTLYEVHGSAKDYAYGALGVPSFTFEVDGEQTRQITRQEDIASKLADELEVTMELMRGARLMNANVSAESLSVPDTVGTGDDAAVEVELANPSYTPANNTTVTVEVRQGGSLVDVRMAVVDVPNESTARARVGLDLEEPGEYQLRVIVEYRELQAENATVKHLVLGTGSTTVERGILGSGAVWGWALLLMALVVVGVLWARRQGWYPGYYLRRLGRTTVHGR